MRAVIGEARNVWEILRRCPKFSDISGAEADDERIAGEVTVISDTEARLNFAKLTEEGQYIVQYIAEEDGHLVAGAISFTYGDRAGQGADAVIWIIFGVVAAAVLGVGAFFSFRRKNAPDGNTVPV